MNRERKVRVPSAKVPEPNWANGCAAPLGARTWWAACAPPLKRTTASTGRLRARSRVPGAQSQSTIVPLPASP
jgi:hypothetical protein